VADFQKDADEIISQVWQSGKFPFIVGGTGLYIKAVIDRYAFGPKGANRELRASLEQLALSEGLEKLYKRLKTCDPLSAKTIHPNDQRRIIRALEVYSTEGRPISGQVSETDCHNSPYQAMIYCVTMDRDLLYRRIELRVDKMIERGFIDEVRNLYQKGYDDYMPGMQILGYRQLLAYIKENLNREEIITEIKKQTRNLAKRQLTWFRREKDIEWLDITDQSLLNDITENICLKVKDIRL
jgi:tRNA dimethylallyltransferase